MDRQRFGVGIFFRSRKTDFEPKMKTEPSYWDLEQFTHGKWSTMSEQSKRLRSNSVQRSWSNGDFNANGNVYAHRFMAIPT